MPRTTLTLFFARDVGQAVILRRGPSQWTRMILWHVDTDQFDLGQWFKGKVYGHDFAPDGKAFIYNAEKYQAFRYQQKRYQWTALCKPPYFTAFALLSIGTVYQSTWEVMFRSRTQILYTGQVNPEPTQDRGRLPRLFKLEPYTEAEPMLFQRWRRDGWRLQGKLPAIDPKYPYRAVWDSRTPLIWQKVTPQGLLLRQMHTHHFPAQITFVHNQQSTLLDNYELVDFDQRGRLIATRDRQLLVLDRADPNHKFTVLADFSDQQPEAIEPPEWVKKW